MQRGNGWGVDRRLEDRPGVPKEADPPRVVGNAHWNVPEPQATPRASLVSPTRPLTPVYSSACPARGVSGMIRRAAYHYPEYRSRRWLMLMLADRVDVLEHNVPRTAWLLGGLGAAALLWLAVRPGARRTLPARGRRLIERSAAGAARARQRLQTA
ncbi:MAG TPA: hypothetical protein VK524_20240 [Polyangiaceae bacterium]|nr:hypothetical protein [Polyangiaceae bacterium]